MNNIEIFQDTMSRINNNILLRQLTDKAIAATEVIKEGFHSSKNPFYENSDFCMEESLTLQAAMSFIDSGKKTAVLNFANPIEPGGGVLRGANAQEEYLCRASNLYPCLTSNAALPYYEFHNKLMDLNQKRGQFIGSDTVIYSTGITIIREDRPVLSNQYHDIPSYEQIYTDHWRTADVITCAAPYFRSKGNLLSDEDLYHLFCKRIRNILETAIEHNVEALVLGAFGCGAFHNPPAIVAKAFSNVFKELRYLHAFSDVVFAIKRSDRFCENIEAFELMFLKFPPKGE